MHLDHSRSTISRAFHPSQTIGHSVILSSRTKTVAQRRECTKTMSDIDALEIPRRDVNVAVVDVFASRSYVSASSRCQSSLSCSVDRQCLREHAIREEVTTNRFLRYLCAATGKRLVILFPEDAPFNRARSITLETLDAIGNCLASCIQERCPMMDIVPIIPWVAEVTQERLDNICMPESIQHHVYALRRDKKKALKLLNDIAAKQMSVTGAKSQYEYKLQPVSIAAVDDTRSKENENFESDHFPYVSTKARIIGDWDESLDCRFDIVACGGTFDRLHAGHRLLLSAAAVVARRQIFIGITTDKLLANKKHGELLEPYEVRESAAVEYMKRVNDNIKVTSGALHDPAKPPLAATDPNFEAVVVSEETIEGAEKINDVRISLGFKPLVIVVVGLISADGKSGKLSSTQLREQEVGNHSS